MKKKDIIFWALIGMMAFQVICGEVDNSIVCWVGAMLMQGLGDV